jgi:hypothetical protein
MIECAASFPRDEMNALLLFQEIMKNPLLLFQETR